MLVDRKAFTATGLAWLLPYLEHPLPDNAALIKTLEMRYRSVTEETESLRVLGALQRQAAIDLRAAAADPVRRVHLRPAGRRASAIGSFGPGWQLGLFGMRSG